MRKFVYLDVGDTLLHLRISPSQIYVNIFQKHQLLTENYSTEFLLSEFYKSMNFLNSKLDKDFRDRYSLHPEGHEGWWKELIELFLKNLKPTSNYISKEIYQEIFSTFEDTSIWEIDKGFYELLEFARENKIGLGIISNWDLRLRNLLTRLNLIENFEHVLISSEFGYEKPSPLIFQEAEKLASTTKENLYYVGDKPELDYYPPRKLGWKSFLISSKPKEGFLQIQNLGELIPYLS